MGKTEKLDTSRKFKKAELDSLRSLYDGMIERGEETRGQTLPEHDGRHGRARAERPLEELEESQTKLKAKEAEKEKLLGYVDNLEERKKKLTREVDRVKRLIEQKDAQYFGLLAWLRGLPGIDMAAPPTKIQQISLPELTINYNFKEVPRYDRCTTCHQGIDRLGYDKDAEGKPMPGVFASHPFLTHGRDLDRPQGEGGHGRALPRPQRPAPDQQLRLHDLPRRPRVGNRLHVRLAHARPISSRRRSGRRSTAGRRSTTGITPCCRIGSSSRAA